VLARFDVRCTAFTALECECCLLGPWDRRWSSFGGVGKPSIFKGGGVQTHSFVCDCRVSRVWRGELSSDLVCKWDESESQCKGNSRTVQASLGCALRIRSHKQLANDSRINN